MKVTLPFPSIAEPVAELVGFAGPTHIVRRALPLPASSGVYVVASADCVSHIGMSSNLRSRVRSLAALGTHRGSAEVLCAAHCTGSAPLVWWYSAEIGSARLLERTLKARYGEPPWPRERYEGCVNGGVLRRDLVASAGEASWEAGFIEAVFAIGEKLALLFDARFGQVWLSVGQPPGPWRS